MRTRENFVRPWMWSCLLAVGFFLAFAGPASALDKMTFRLEWKLTGYHLPFYWAKEKGLYKAEDLDVDIKEGSGSGKTVNLIGANQDTVGFADYMVMARAISKGMKVKAVYAIVQKSAWAIVAFEDAKIRKPQDLVGKSVGMVAGHKSLLDLFLTHNDVDPSKVVHRIVTSRARNTLFAQGTVDSIVSITIGSPMDFVVQAREGKGKPVHFVKFSDFGIFTLAQGLLAHEDTIREKGDILRRFLRASTKGWREASKPENVNEALKIAVKFSPANVGRAESVRLQFLETLGTMHTPNSAGRPIGWMSEKDWKASLELMQKTTKDVKVLPVNEYYTNEFISN